MNKIDVASERAYPTPFANSPLLPLLLMSLTIQKNSPNTAKTIKKEYDYVIVGAGSAGSVVASRLSEIPCVTVLLLEAGKPPPLLTDVPSIRGSFLNSDIDWQYRTVPQKHTAAALVNRQVLWPSGKTLGGSSILNGLLYVRGNPKNYDRWAAEGAEGWSYKDVLPYFKKMEDNRDDEYVGNGYHGMAGPLTVHRPRYRAEITDPLFEAATSMGFDIVDPNARGRTGFYDFQATMRSGQRCSTAKAYLVPAENRTNLDILPNAMARKVVIENHKAIGVEFDFRNNTYEVKARREVILSAGTVNTAQLLMLSGIGPKKELKRFKIPVVADLPVGKNLQDHCGSLVNFRVNPKIPTVEEKLSDPRNIERYIQNRTGPLGSANFNAVLAFVNKKDIRSSRNFPDIEYAFIEALPEFGTRFGLTPEANDQIYGPYEGKPFYVCLVQLLNPKSRGTVKLKSRNPYVPPIIDPNYLEDEKDIKDLAEGLRTCLRIGTSAPMRRVGSSPFRTLIPNCEKYVDDEDQYLMCTVRSVIYSFNHPVGTARMGDPEDLATVVDPQLRVKRMKRLRVIDASVMPIIPSGNINVPTIMVAEKASDLIKSTIKCHQDSGSEDQWGKAEDSELTDDSDYLEY